MLTYDFTIRCANTQDMEDIFSLETQCHSFPWTEQLLKEELRNPNSYHYILLNKNHKPVGYILSRIILDEVHIHSIAISPQYRRKGFGELLITHLLQSVMKKNVKKAFLEVRCSNQPAIRLYERCGFESVGIRKKYYKNGENALVMLRYLQK
ncbi:MAG: ribosomal protein S18-alanine N-acetyltransferase [Chitinispirillaceae bacterium]